MKLWSKVSQIFLLFSLYFSSLNVKYLKFTKMDITRFAMKLFIYTFTFILNFRSELHYFPFILGWYDVVLSFHIETHTQRHFDLIWIYFIFVKTVALQNIQITTEYTEVKIFITSKMRPTKWIIITLIMGIMLSTKYNISTPWSLHAHEFMINLGIWSSVWLYMYIGYEWCI